jgi:hypothetical protein
MRTQMNQDKNCTSVHLHIPVWLVKRTRFFLLAVVEVNLTACGNFFLIVHYWCTHAMIDACGNELQTRAASATGTWTPRWTGSLHAAGRPPPRTDADDTMLTINIKQCELDAPAADGILLNTFDSLERRAHDAILARLPNTFTMGPLGPEVSSLWAWLDGHAGDEASVVYVNFGSITVVMRERMDEFAWGLADVGCPFLWVVRPDMVRDGGGWALPAVFEDAVAGRRMTVGWCD